MQHCSYVRPECLELSLVGIPGQSDRASASLVEGRGRTTAQAGSGQHHEGGPDFVLGELFAAGSGPSSWRSEVDFEDIWAGPGRKDRILACGDGERLFQAERMCEPVE